MDVENTGNCKFCEEAFEDDVNENVVNTENAFKPGDEKIMVEICVDVNIYYLNTSSFSCFLSDCMNFFHNCLTASSFSEL